MFSGDQNSTAFNTPRNDEFGGTLVTVIMALYLLVANILLLNLLIAIFKLVQFYFQVNQLFFIVNVGVVKG